MKSPYQPYDELTEDPGISMTFKQGMFCIGMFTAALCTILFAGSKETREIETQEQRKEPQHGR